MWAHGHRGGGSRRRAHSEGTGLRDATGEIQLFLEKKRVNGNVPEDGAKTFKNLLDWVDAGDVVGATGTAKRTEKGELSVYLARRRNLPFFCRRVAARSAPPKRDDDRKFLVSEAGARREARGRARETNATSD